MTVHESARTERKAHAHNRCEAVHHHDDCPREAAPWCESQFVLHHTIRRGDKWALDYDHRDDVEHLRFVWNGPTGLGLSGCHKEIHDDLTRSRALNLLTTPPVPLPAFGPVELVDTTIGPVPRSTLDKQPDHIQERLTA